MPSDGRWNNVPFPRFAASGDFNRDGRADIGLANAVGQFSILLNQMPQVTPTITPTATATQIVPTDMPTSPAPTFQPPTNTPTDLPENTATPPIIPSNTSTDLPTDTATATDTSTPTSSATATPTVEPRTNTPTDQPTNTPTVTASNTRTNTPSATLTPTHTPSQSSLRVKIDIKPGSAVNPINRKSEGTIPVAILSARGFDARTVDPLTIRLAGAPVKLKPNGQPMASFVDVNRDGLPDLLVHVVTQSLNLKKTDKTATLEGRIFSGRAIWGIDAVKIVA